MSLDPLDPELAALFEDAPVPSAPAEAKARAFERLAALSAAPPKATTSKAGAATELGRRAIGLAATTFVVGAIVGGLVVSARQPLRVVYVDRPAPVIAAPSSSAAPSVMDDTTTASPLATATAISPPSIPNTTRAVPSAIASSRADDLAAERALLDHARRSLASDGGVEALGLLDSHAKRFPRGKLAEEREALAIEALVHAGRPDEARTRAAEFRRKSPQSLYLEAIDVTLHSIP